MPPKVSLEWGIPSSFLLGSLLANLFLDDLEPYLRLTLEAFNVSTNRIRCIRYLSSILIVGKASTQDMEEVYLTITQYLKKKSLRAVHSLPLVKTFEPGNQFEYLSFKFIFPNANHKSKVNHGRFTKLTNSFSQLCRNQITKEQRAKPFALIKANVFKHFKRKFMLMLTRNRAILPISEVIFQEFFRE